MAQRRLRPGPWRTDAEVANYPRLSAEPRRLRLARIRDSEQGKRRNLGYFVKEAEAAEAYEAALKERKKN